MGKIRDLFNKIKDTRGTFYAKIEGQKWYGSTKQNKKILRGGDKNTQKNYKEKIFMTKIITMV